MHNFSVPIGPMWSFISTRPESRDFKTPKPHRKHFYLVCFYLITLFYLYSRYFRKYGFQNVTCKWERDRRGRDCMVYVGDRPFSLQGGGGYGFLFRSEIFFRTPRRLEYFFPPEFNIRLYDRNSESDYFFFPPSKIRIFFSAIFFLEKNHNPLPPFKLNGPSLVCSTSSYLPIIQYMSLLKL